MLKIAVGCTTYNRPHLLGEFIQSYLMQTYPASHRELIILDDAGQYGNRQGEGWQIISFPRRFASLGEKRNAAFSLAAPDTDIFVITDDDDIYMPWWLEAHARNFERGAAWSAAEWFYESVDNSDIRLRHFQDTHGYRGHPSHAYTKKLFWNVGGYSPLSGWEDQDLFSKFRGCGHTFKNALDEKTPPYMIYRRFSGGKHLAGVPLKSYQDPERFAPILPSATLEIGWKRDYITEIAAYEKTRVEKTS